MKQNNKEGIEKERLIKKIAEILTDYKFNSTCVETAEMTTERIIGIVNQLKEKEMLDVINKDIMLFEDARDILINLKEQGVGTGDCEKLFDNRIVELKQKLKGASNDN